MADIRSTFRLIRQFRRLGRRELTILGCLAVAAGGVWAFAEVADEVLERETRAVDEALLLALRDPADTNDPLGPVWLEELGRDVTALGSMGVLTFVTLAAVGFVVLERRHAVASLILVSVGGGWLLSTFLKLGFDRPRPDLVPHVTAVSTASFPSGHSMMAAVTYLTLGALLARVQPRPRLKLYLLFLAVLITIAVGTSRVYLGVHWPTDVLAGWTIGAAWAASCWSIALWLQSRGRIQWDRNGKDVGARDP